MSKFNIFKLEFRSPLHLSRGKLHSYESSDTVLHSDTIKSAMLATALQIFDFSQEEIKAFWDSFQVSSAMPYYGNDYFMVRPLSWQPKAPNAAEQKDWNKLEYLQHTDFQTLINGNEIVELPNIPKFFHKEQTQRVQVKHDEDSVPFYIEKLYFEAKAGLYFIIDCESAVLNRLQGVMELLGENGIGLQRNIGNGHFVATLETLDLELPQSDKYMSLSLYCPTEDELKNVEMEQSFYKLQKRGGWVSSSSAKNITYRKKSIFMFNEGSVFQNKNVDDQLLIKGKSVEIAPDVMKRQPVEIAPDVMQGQPVWREGRGVFISIK